MITHPMTRPERVRQLLESLPPNTRVTLASEMTTDDWRAPYRLADDLAFDTVVDRQGLLWPELQSAGLQTEN